MKFKKISNFYLVEDVGVEPTATVSKTAVLTDIRILNIGDEGRI